MTDVDKNTLELIRTAQMDKTSLVKEPIDEKAESTEQKESDQEAKPEEAVEEEKKEEAVPSEQEASEDTKEPPQKEQPELPLDGWCVLRNENDRLMQKVCYAQGKKQGEFTVYLDDELVQKGFYKDDVLDGPLEFFDKKRLSARVHYIDGKKNGSAQFYKGNYMVIENHYKDDVLDGPTISYYPNTKQKSMEAAYKDGEYEGIMTTYTDGGVVARTVTYTKGKRHGKCLLYYPTGEVFEESYFAEDIACRVSTQFYPNGAKKYERYFDLDGNAVREVSYDMLGTVLTDVKKPEPKDEPSPS